MARVFSFILETKHKTLHVKRAWAELEIQQKNILPEFRSIECMRFSLVTLESYDNVGDNNVGEASSKAKKRKT